MHRSVDRPTAAACTQHSLPTRPGALSVCLPPVQIALLLRLLRMHRFLMQARAYLLLAALVHYPQQPDAAGMRPTARRLIPTCGQPKTMSAMPLTAEQSRRRALYVTPAQLAPTKQVTPRWCRPCMCACTGPAAALPLTRATASCLVPPCCLQVPVAKRPRPPQDKETVTFVQRELQVRMHPTFCGCTEVGRRDNVGPLCRLCC